MFDVYSAIFCFCFFLIFVSTFFPLFTLNDENRFDSQIKFYGLVYSRSRLKWLIVKGIVACLFYALAKRRFNRKNESKTSTTDWSEIYSVAFFANCRCNEINIGLIRCNGRAKWKLLKYKWDAPRICKIELAARKKVFMLLLDWNDASLAEYVKKDAI